MAAFRFALIELYCDLLQSPSGWLPTLLSDTLRAAPEAREQAVRDVLAALRGIEVQVVVFPGWTLVGNEVPEWVTEATEGRTFAVEMLPPEAEEPAQAFVIRDRQVLVGPVAQLFWSGDDVGYIGSPSEEAVQLAAELAGAAPDRRWSETAWPSAGLILCGEVNVIKTEGGNTEPTVAGLPSFDLILNPAHTPSKLPAMTTKRRYFSRMRPNGVLLSTATIHGQWKQINKKGKEVTGKSGHVAAEAFQAGEELEATDAVEVGRHRIQIYS